LEYSDELIGRIMAVLQQDTVFALVSDHGFETVEKTVHPSAGKVTPFVVSADDPNVAAKLEELRNDPANGIGRRIPQEEWKRFMPNTPAPLAAYESADRFLFSPNPTEGPYGKPYEIGTHGFCPAGPTTGAFFCFVTRRSGCGDSRNSNARHLSASGPDPH
jgi:hypothetical protein